MLKQNVIYYLRSCRLMINICLTFFSSSSAASSGLHVLDLQCMVDTHQGILCYESACLVFRLCRARFLMWVIFWSRLSVSLCFCKHNLLWIQSHCILPHYWWSVISVVFFVFWGSYSFCLSLKPTALHTEYQCICPTCYPKVGLLL